MAIYPSALLSLASPQNRADDESPSATDEPFN